MNHYNKSSTEQQRNLQGPRPAPLKVRKDSHKIQKPPIVHHPPVSQSSSMKQQPPSAPPPPPPVIIYDVSPKVIHTSPRNFMDVVQKLTGPDPPTASSSSTLSCPADQTLESGQPVALSPAATFTATTVPFKDNDDYHHFYGSFTNHVDQTQTGLVDGHPTTETTTVAEGFISTNSSIAAYEAERLSGSRHNFTFLPGTLSPTPGSFPRPVFFPQPLNSSLLHQQHHLHQDNFISEILPNNQHTTITNNPTASLTAPFFISPHNPKMRARFPHPP